MTAQATGERLRRWAVAVLAALAALHAGPAPAQVYDVVGVAADDVLNIRGDIDTVEHFSQAPVVGSFPAGAAGILATGRSYMLGGTEWREVRHPGGTGWVNARFLHLSAIFPPSGAFSCGGTEPFWDIALTETGGKLRLMGEDRTVRLKVEDGSGAAGWRNVRTYAFSRSDAPARPIGVLAFNQACTDGMSDFTYAYEFFLIGLDGGVDALYGCCTTR